MEIDKLKTICRYCKKEIEWTGERYGYCNNNCKRLKEQQRKPSKLFPELHKEINKL